MIVPVAVFTTWNGTKHTGVSRSVGEMSLVINILAVKTDVLLVTG